MQSSSVKNIDWKKIYLDQFDNIKLHKLVIKYGLQILFQYDEEGFYPIHWATLAGRMKSNFKRFLQL